MLLIVFRNAKWIQPIVKMIKALLLFVLFVIAGGIAGFFVGYLRYGNSVPVWDIFSSESDIWLDMERSKVLVCSLVGAVLGIVLFLLVNFIVVKISKKRHSTVLDELLELNELKEKGIITQDKFDQQKKKRLNVE